MYSKWIRTALLGCVLVVGCGKDSTDMVPPLASVETADTAATRQPAAEMPADFRLSNFRWSGPMDATGSVHIRNPYGDIRCRGSGEDKLIISAQIQTFTTWQAKPAFEVVEVDGVTEVRISHEHPARVLPNGDYQSGFAGRVDITLLLPDGTEFDAETTDGAIRVKGYNGAVRAVSAAGEIYYKSHGPLDLRNGSGAIEAILRRFAADEPARLQTGSGNIALRMTPEVSAAVKVATTGTIETEIIDAVAQRQTRKTQALELLLGKAERRVEVLSERGNVLIAVDRSYSIDRVDD